MTQIAIPQNYALPAALQGMLPQLKGNAQDLTAGVGGVPVISIRGRAFRFKHRGMEVVVQTPEGFPAPYLDVLMIKAAPQFSKIYYAAAYAEGDDNAPDCFSVDGIVPDASVAQKQCATCGACPQNQWGSKITPQGTKVKACQDSRRVVVVPAFDPMNEAWGGCALLRVPPASLGDLATFGNQLQAAGLPYQAAVVRLSFDPQVAYPKLNFTFLGLVNEAQANAVAFWFGHEQTARILSAIEAAPAQQQAPVLPSVYTGPPQPQAIPQQAPAPQYAPMVVPPPPQAQPQPVQMVAPPVAQMAPPQPQPVQMVLPAPGMQQAPPPAAATPTRRGRARATQPVQAAPLPVAATPQAAPVVVPPTAPAQPAPANAAPLNIATVPAPAAPPNGAGAAHVATEATPQLQSMLQNLLGTGAPTS